MAKLCTYAFHPDDLSRCAQWFCMQGFRCWVRHEKKGPTLTFSVASSKQLFRVIKPYTLPSLHYKLDGTGHPWILRLLPRYKAPVIEPCPECGRPVQRVKSRLLCDNPQCARTRNNQSVARSSRRNPRYEEVAGVCVICEQPFQRTRKKQYGAHVPQTCSRRCHAFLTGHVKRVRRYGEEIARTVSQGVFSGTCVTCGTPFQKKVTILIPDQLPQTCSRHCQERLEGQQRK